MSKRILNEKRMRVKELAEAVSFERDVQKYFTEFMGLAKSRQKYSCSSFGKCPMAFYGVCPRMLAHKCFYTRYSLESCWLAFSRIEVERKWELSKRFS